MLELSCELARMGHQVDIFTRRDGELPRVEEIEPRLRVVRIDAGPARPLDKEELVPLAEEFVDGARRFIAAEGAGYDLVHSHYWQSARAGGVLAGELGVPHAVMFHTLGEVKNRARITEEEPAFRIAEERRVVAAADLVVTASDHERDLLQRYYGARASRLATVPCGVDIERFQALDRGECRRRLGLAEDAPVLIWVGRLEKLKGVDILIEALAQLDDREFTLLIVGGDERARALKAELQAQVREAGLEGNVRFVGAVPHDDLPTYYSAADVCVVPSYYESFGLVAVEAMACGVPVVASRVGGLVSTVTDGVSGYLIPWRCPEPFAEKLEVLLNNPELRANFSRSARISVERFRWRSVATQVAGLYRGAIDDYRARTGSSGHEAAALPG